jgi:hypothetical protein
VTGPVPSHRRTTRAGRLGAALLGTGLVIAALLAGRAITSHAPDADKREQPFVRTGRVNHPVDGRTFVATVLGVRGGPKLNGGGQPHDTSGIWVLTRVRLVARAAPTSVGFAALVDDRDRAYWATGRITQFLAGGGRTLEPGIPVVGEIAFEIPLSAATHLRLRLAGPQFDQRMDAVTECRLPIDSAMLAQWRAQSEPLQLEKPEVAP